jgi:hypothetical protein
LEEAIDRNIAAFVDFIDRNYIPTPAVFNPFDFGRKAQYLTLDVISDIAFGKSFGDVQSDSDVHQYRSLGKKSPNYNFGYCASLVKHYLAVTAIQELSAIRQG